MPKRAFFKPALLAVLDCLFCYLSWIGSIFVFTYLFVADYSLISTVTRYLWVLIPLSAVSFTLTGTYKCLWQHPGIGSILRLATSVFLTSFGVYVTLRIDMGYWSNPGLGMMAFYFFFTLSLGIRMYSRIYQTIRQFLKRSAKARVQSETAQPINTLVIGAGESASSFLTNPHNRGNRVRRVLGILDNDPRKQGYSLHGVRVMGGDDMIPELCHQLDIDEIIVAVPSMPNEALRRIVSLTPANRCKVRLLTDLPSAENTGDRLRDIDIGDLLGRPENILDTKALGMWIKGKTVMITGGGGSIGSELCRQVLRYEPEKLVIFDISENNAHNLKEELILAFGQKGRYRTAIRIGSVQDEARLDEVFSEFKPNIIFHAAAYKHVPLMEECPRLALENNVLGTYRSALAASRHNAERFVMISTDKAVNPTNIMGASKRLAELLLLSLNGESATEFVCVRFGNVLDSNGSVVPKFKRQIETGGPVTVTHQEIIRYFMTIPEAAGLVLEAGAMAQGGEIFILDMGQPVKITELAENLIRMAGLVPYVDIKIEFTGLRPGEKLYEELLLDEEGLGKTSNEKIHVARPVPMTRDSRDVFLKDLHNVTEHESDGRELIKKYVPEFRPKI